LLKLAKRDTLDSAPDCSGNPFFWVSPFSACEKKDWNAKRGENVEMK